MAKQKQYWLWIESKRGCLPHELHKELEKDGLVWGREVQTWTTALLYLRDAMKRGYVVRVYETEG
jgi:hypothetical protein